MADERVRAMRIKTYVAEYYDPDEKVRKPGVFFFWGTSGPPSHTPVVMQLNDKIKENESAWFPCPYPHVAEAIKSIHFGSVSDEGSPTFDEGVLDE